MLISVKVDAARLFGTIRAVVVDEVHAFGSDDRGWHLLAVLERISRLASWPAQRIGLSATIGNPGELLDWLQGSGRGNRPAAAIAPDAAAAAKAGAATDVQLVLGHALLTTTQIYLTPRKEDVIRRILAHHAEQTRTAAERVRPSPAPGYRPETLEVLFGTGTL